MFLDCGRKIQGQFNPLFLWGVKSIKSENRTAPKKSWDFKGGKGWGYKDANAINDKAVYCYARYALQHLQAQHICYKGELTTCKNSKSKIRMSWRKNITPMMGVKSKSNPFLFGWCFIFTSGGKHFLLCYLLIGFKYALQNATSGNKTHI